MAIVPTPRPDKSTMRARAASFCGGVPLAIRRSSTTRSLSNLLNSLKLLKKKQANRSPERPSAMFVGAECAAMLPRHSRAGGVDHIVFNPLRPQPPRQPEAVAARFDRDPLDFLSRLDRFIPPAQQHQRSSEYALFSERGDNGGIDHVNLPFSTVLRRSGL